MARRDGAMAERMEAEGFEVVAFSGGGRGPRAIWQMRRALRRLRPDVLHYNDPHALTAAGLASVGLGIPARIAMRHVSWPIHSPWRFRRLSDRVVCVSNAVAGVCRSAGLPPDMLRVVFECTDPQKVRAGNRRQGRLAAGVSDDRPMILVVASLNEHKGHAFLLEALPTVFGRYPNAAVVLAGDGPQKESLQLQARQLKVEDRVQFLGYRKDIPDLIRAADLLVLPSLAGEGLPLTLVDSMFAGVPFVATAVGGIDDITGGDASAGEPVAWVVEPRDSTALAAAIIEALDNPEQRALRADRARLRAERFFTADHMVDAMLAVYREVLEKSEC